MEKSVGWEVGNPKNPATTPSEGTATLRLSAKKLDERGTSSMMLTKATVDELGEWGMKQILSRSREADLGDERLSTVESA
ncbi:unnamed protein product [Linum trigynum]|uniref:Uncharacterized protein n=1 Tax=Linum trigynum TaxID=586398 RepID=A0AAV2F407_9ROSI